MGLFKGMKDMANLTKQAKEMQAQQQEQAGYKPGLGGQMAQMGDMLSQANEQMAELNDQSGDQSRLLTEGIAAQGVIVGMGTPARGAMNYNLDIDLEVHVPGREPYRVANQYIVPAAAQIGPGVTLPIRVDPSDQSKIAIDWNQAARSPERGEVRPAGGCRDARRQPRPRRHRAAGTRSPSSSGWRSCATPAPSATPSSSSRRRASSAADADPVAPEVEFLWWSECPSWERALADLKAAMVENGLDPGSIDEREIESEAQAEAEGFPGSPTIRVNGEDVAEPAEGMPRGLVCRVYLRRDRRVSPLPDPLDMREALARPAVDCSCMY